MKPAPTLSYFLLFILFVLLGTALNFPGLNAPMYYDSAVLIADNRDLFGSGMIENVLAIFPQRPLPMFTFYLNFIVGDMAPVYFRIFNIVLLAATALTVVVLINLILDLPGVCDRATQSEKRMLSLALGLFFLVHPLHTYLTLYIVQRMALMACLFYYLSLVSYIAVRAGKIGNFGYVLCLIFYVCAQFSKENSFTLALTLILIELAFFRHTWRDIFNRGVIFSAITLLAVAALSQLEHPHGKEDMGSGILATIIQYYKESGITPVEVILTQSRTLFEYISIIVVPSPDRAQLVQPYVISRSVLDPPITLLAVVGAGVLLALAIYLLRKRPLSGFGLLLFLVNISTEYILVPQYAFFGYRAALPMPGLLLMFADLLLIAMQKAKHYSKPRVTNLGIAGVLGLWILLAAGVSINRIEIWANPVSFWQGVVDRLPDNNENFERKVASQTLSNLSYTLQREDRDIESIAYAERAVELSPDRARYRSQLALTYSRVGRQRDAEKTWAKAIELDPDFAQAHVSLARLLLDDERSDEAWVHLKKAESLAPENAGLQDLIGLAMLAENQFDEARKHFLLGIEVDRLEPVLYYHLALALLTEGKAQQSIEYSRKALQLDSEYWQAYDNLGVAHAQLNQLEQAVFYLKKALSINPENADTRSKLARIQAEIDAGN
ncbi:MAG: tetratricopeptide repeat protein [Gammaproteobacteria bacterium]|nr:tetratricopeptide repeat protein [Gammaproteobacteria bacterium]